jgi:thioredoxin reductase
MTAPATLPLVGKVKFTETTKEALIEFWKKVASEHELRIRFGTCVEAIEQTPSGFVTRTNRGTCESATVLLAIGRRGTPRKLGVPGEDLHKVTYRLLDPEQYRGMRVLIVGGGDSALESAITISEQPATQVTLSYRSASFGRAKKKNRARLEESAEAGRVRVLLESNVTSICEGHVEIEQAGKTLTLGNDAIIINAGGVLPTQFLRQAGIGIETKFGTA